MAPQLDWMLGDEVPWLVRPLGGEVLSELSDHGAGRLLLADLGELGRIFRQVLREGDEGSPLKLDCGEGDRIAQRFPCAVPRYWLPSTSRQAPGGRLKLELIAADERRRNLVTRVRVYEATGLRRNPLVNCEVVAAGGERVSDLAR